MTTYNFTPRDRPPGFGDNSIIQTGKLNNDGDFVGSAWNLMAGPGGDFFVGFVYDSGTYKTIKYPGSNYTTAEGINDRDQIVGSYRTTNTTGGSRGFVYEGSTYKSIEFPNSRANYASDINNSGVVTGFYTDNDRLNHGYIYDSGSFTTIDVPGATNSYLFGSNDRGVAVGRYELGANESFGLIYENGTLRTLSYPGATSTNLSDVSNDGTIVGQAYLSGGTNAPATTIGFTYKNGVFDRVDGTADVYGINDRGQLLARSQANNIQISDPLCFVTGTLIRTMRGEVPVEGLSVGDRAITATGEFRPIRWIGRRTIDCSRTPRPSAVWPVRVRADAFGPGLPARTLRLSPGHPILVSADADGRGGVLVPIVCLINGTTIAREPATSVTYWHVELDTHDILLAEGIPAESYYDMGGRAWFSGAEGALIDPDFVPAGEHGRCRPVAVDGSLVEAERQRLSAVFAAALAVQCDWDDAGRVTWPAG